MCSSLRSKNLIMKSLFFVQKHWMGSFQRNGCDFVRLIQQVLKFPINHLDHKMTVKWLYYSFYLSVFVLSHCRTTGFGLLAFAQTFAFAQKLLTSMDSFSISLFFPFFFFFNFFSLPWLLLPLHSLTPSILPLLCQVMWKVSVLCTKLRHATLGPHVCCVFFFFLFKEGTLNIPESLCDLQ